MRFVASTILSVAILAFVTQSVSAVPAGSTIDVKKVNQESNSILKRDGMYNIGTFDVNGSSNTNINNINVALDELLDGCFKGLVPPEVCEEAFGPGLH
jgi:hypothetical protein